MRSGVTIKAIGHISSLLGASEVVIPCQRQLPVSALLAQLGERYPLFSKYINQSSDCEQYVLVVREGKMEAPDAIIHPGEVLVLVTPVSGGGG